MRQALEELFVQWGMPIAIRVDNGMPLGDPQRKSIPELALWLLCKDIEVIFNRPRLPTDNAKVERMQRTTKNWAEVTQAKDIDDLAARLEQAIIIQREKLKVRRLGRRTRLQAYPSLVSNNRLYSPDYFCVEKAYKRLEGWTMVRKVSSHGQISLYGVQHHIGKQHKGAYVSIKLHSQSLQWIVYDGNNNLIAQCQASNLSADNIKNLSVGQRTYD